MVVKRAGILGKSCSSNCCIKVSNRRILFELTFIKSQRLCKLALFHNCIDFLANLSDNSFTLKSRLGLKSVALLHILSVVELSVVYKRSLSEMLSKSGSLPSIIHDNKESIKCHCCQAKGTTCHCLDTCVAMCFANELKVCVKIIAEILQIKPFPLRV